MKLSVLKNNIIFFLCLIGFIAFAIFCPFANWAFAMLWIITLLAYMYSFAKREQQKEIIDKLLSSYHDAVEGSGKLAMTNEFLMTTLKTTEETDNDSIEEKRKQEKNISTEETGN